MAYTTTTALSARLGPDLYARLTDRAAGTTASGAVAQQIVDEAEAQVDSYLATRFATPLDAGADAVLANMLEGRALDVAEYLAWRGSPFVDDVPERVRTVFEEAQLWLQNVAAGRIELPAAARPLGPAVRGPLAESRGGERAFTSEELDGL